MLFAPFWSGPTHVVAFRAIFPDVPERKQRNYLRAGNLAEAGNQNGCDDPKLSHVTLLGASVPNPKFARIGGPRFANFGFERTLETL